MSSSPSSGLKRRRVESQGMKWIEAEFFPSVGPSRQARQAWDDDLPEQFEVVRSVGEGTFSTVWLARERSNASDSVYALKRVNPTCSPSRILNEYHQMRKLGGKHNVIQVHGLIRTSGGAFAMVMPYFEHDDFKLYIRTLTISGIAAYMRSLLTALAHVHAEGVIHRDIKPRNFIYSVEKQEGLLIDFGLAEPADRWRSRIDALARHRAHRGSGRARSPRTGARRDTSLTPIALSQVEAGGLRERQLDPTGQADGTGKPGGDGFGDESRAAEGGGVKVKRALLRKAERGGTTGFRAPEVLWHSRDQVMAPHRRNRSFYLGVFRGLFVERFGLYLNSWASTLARVSLTFAERPRRKFSPVSVGDSVERSLWIRAVSISDRCLSPTELVIELYRRFAPVSDYHARICSSEVRKNLRRRFWM